MKRNCNLELRLVTPSVYSRSSDYSANTVNDGDGRTKDEQQLAIFYDGKFAVSDATELQARAILWLASREVEEKSSSGGGGGGGGSDGYYSSKLTSPIYSPTAGMSSMKGSLKAFLEKRKSRAQATSPYPITTISMNFSGNNKNN